MAQARAQGQFTEEHFLQSYELAYGKLLSPVTEQSLQQT
jgi:hypothetical protein